MKWLGDLQIICNSQVAWTIHEPKAIHEFRKNHASTRIASCLWCWLDFLPLASTAFSSMAPSRIGPRSSTLGGGHAAKALYIRIHVVKYSLRYCLLRLSENCFSGQPMGIWELLQQASGVPDLVRLQAY
jgi:hypothetical protein